MKHFLAALAVLAAAPPAAQAALILFTDEATFVGAVGAHDLETFESVATGNYGTSAAFGPLTFSSPPSSNILITATGSFGARNTTPGGRLFLEAVSSPAFHDDMFMGRTDGPLVAWGANFTDLDFGVITFYVDGVPLYSPLPGPNSNVKFVGFIGTAGDTFNTVTLEVNDNTYGIDDVRTRVVPEPSTIVLLALGLAAAGIRRRRA